MRRAVPVFVALFIIMSVLPATAEGVTEVSDTLYIIKEDQTASNADVAVALSQATPLTPNRVLIGRDDVFVDSMTSGVLQGQSPLLLVPPAGPIPDSVLAELSRLGPARVTLLGGEAALQPAVAQELSAIGYTVDRRSGASRFETAIAIAEDGPVSSTVIMARAFAAPDSGDPTQAFADSLAAGGLAAENGWPILLTDTATLPQATRNFLVDNAVQRVLLMGGTAAISADVQAGVEQVVGQVDRISGPNRFATGIEVAKELGAQSAADVARITLVDGQGPDAWAGGFAAAAHSAFFDAPIVLGTADALPGPTGQWLQGGTFTGRTSAGTMLAGTMFAGNASGFRLTCVIDSDVCEEGRQALSLPPAVGVTFTPASGSTVAPGSQVRIDVGAASAQLAGGSCLDSATGPLPAGGTLTITSQAAAATCAIIVTIDLGGGVTQTETATYALGAASALALVSVDAQGNAIGGRLPDMADNGAAVVFLSDGDPTGQAADGLFHVYLVTGGGIQLVDVRPDGSPATGMSSPSVANRPRVSADGSVVLFQSRDPGLADVGSPATTATHLYRRDITAATTALVSRDAQGNPVAQLTYSALSDRGDVVAFVGDGVGPTGAQSIQVFIANLATGNSDVVRLPDGSPFLNATVSGLDLSAVGGTVVFNSSRPELVDGDTNARDDTFAYDQPTEAMELISVNDQGAGTIGDGAGIDQQVAVSGDGSRVVFSNGATNLVGTGNGGDDIFVRDRTTRTTLLVSRTDGAAAHTDDASQPDISGDGTFVTFRSPVVPSGDPTGGGCGIYRATDVGPPQRVDVAADGTFNRNGCSSIEFATVASTGTVAFSVFDDLTPQDTNGVPDVYLFVG